MKVGESKFTIGKLENPAFKIHLFSIVDILPDMQVPGYRKVKNDVQEELIVALKDITFEMTDFFDDDNKINNVK